MKDTDPSDQQTAGQLSKRIEELENRISRLEELSAGIGQDEIHIFPKKKVHREAGEPRKEEAQNEVFESRIGEYGMAWMGNIVLLVGILFLTQYLQYYYRALISLVFGFSSIVIVYLLGYLTRKSLAYMSTLFNYNGHLLLYIQVMRISMFKDTMIIQSPVLSQLLVLLVLLSLIYLAHRNSSQILAVLSWIMVGITAVTSGSTQ